MKRIIGKVTPTVVAVSAALVVGGGATYAATGLIHTRDIADGAVTSPKLAEGAVHLPDIADGAKQALAGKDGKDGKDGRDGLAGAIYRVENYTNGGGGDATVACADDDAESQKYTAIAGGVEAGHLGTNDFAVTASFPGRMNWATGEPKADRLDGWIVLGNGKYTDNLKVWALCVPTTSIPVQTVNLNN